MLFVSMVQTEVDAIKRGACPFYEKGLEAMLRKISTSASWRPRTSPLGSRNGSLVRRRGHPIRRQELI